MSDYQQMVDDCEVRESRLSDWEIEFISSISDQLGSGKTLTTKQAAVLDRIWDNATEEG